VLEDQGSSSPEQGRTRRPKNCGSGCLVDVRGWAKLELGLEVSPGKVIALLVELARVGDPLVDQDEAGSVLRSCAREHRVEGERGPR